MNANLPASGRFLRLSFLGVLAYSLTILVLYFWPAPTLLDRFEWRTVDWRFQLRGPQQPKQPIVIVTVDEESIRRLGRWPWPRKIFARLIRHLQAAGARCIVFDIFFTEYDASPGGAASDVELIRATQEAGNVFHAGFIYLARGTPASAVPPQIAARAWEHTAVQPGRGLAYVAQLIEPAAVTFPLPELAAAARGFGVANVLDSGDGIYRHLVPLIRYQGRLYPSVALAVAADYYQIPPEKISVIIGQEIRLGARRIPLDMQGRFLIDYLGGDHIFPYFSAADVLNRTPTQNKEQFQGKIVLIGVTAPGIYDLRANPFATIYYGVEAQASALEAMLSGRFLRQASPLAIGLFLLLLIPTFGIILPRQRTFLMTLLALSALILYPWLCVRLFIQHHFVLNLIFPFFAMLGNFLIIVTLRLLLEERRRHQIQTILQHFVPPQLVGRLVQEEAYISLRGERREISVMFADIRNFTATAEALAPEDTVTFLNRYFTLMNEIIWEHEGTLDKYIGDEIMIFFNAPLAQPDHARRAVMTAIDIQRRIMANQAEWEYLQVPNLAAGIGIATGPAVVGYVGSPQRMQYTVIGQTVNLASRLQALCKPLGCRILISDETYRAVADLIVAQDLGKLPISGFHQPMRVWNVLDYRDEKLRGQWEPVGTPIPLPASAQISEDAV